MKIIGHDNDLKTSLLPRVSEAKVSHGTINVGMGIIVFDSAGCVVGGGEISVAEGARGPIFNGGGS
jgi:hypothetical protein